MIWNFEGQLKENGKRVLTDADIEGGGGSSSKPLLSIIHVHGYLDASQYIVSSFDLNEEEVAYTLLKGGTVLIYDNDIGVYRDYPRYSLINAFTVETDLDNPELIRSIRIVYFPIEYDNYNGECYKKDGTTEYFSTVLTKKAINLKFDVNKTLAELEAQYGK